MLYMILKNIQKDDIIKQQLSNHLSLLNVSKVNDKQLKFNLTTNYIKKSKKIKNNTLHKMIIFFFRRYKNRYERI